MWLQCKVPVSFRQSPAIGALATMDDLLVIGAGPAGLLAASVASGRGARVRILAAGIGTTHLCPGWIGVLDTEAPAILRRGDGRPTGSPQDLTDALNQWITDYPEHPYALAGLDALEGGISAFREVCAVAGLEYAGDLRANYRLPTALGALAPAALAPASFIAGDARLPGEMLIAGPAGWRDFYPALCAGNLARQGVPARSVVFTLPDAGKFDATPVGLARLFERSDVRARVTAQLKANLNGVARVGFPAVLGLEKHAEVWRDLQDRLEAPVFEIPTLPPSVPGMRLYGVLRKALQRAGARILLDMTVARGMIEGGRAVGVVVPSPAREATYRADQIILASGGLYGGGLVTDRHGELREAIFDLALSASGSSGEWFDERLLSLQGHPIHCAGVRINRQMQPIGDTGEVLLEGVRVAGRLIAGYNPVVEASTEGVVLATAYRAASS
jgi:glycerol-3-phosphate dehydrogenase subunit B